MLYLYLRHSFIEQVVKFLYFIGDFCYEIDQIKRINFFWKWSLRCKWEALLLDRKYNIGYWEPLDENDAEFLES